MCDKKVLRTTPCYNGYAYVTNCKFIYKVRPLRSKLISITTVS
jgi:hypothetical protein